MAVIRSVLNTWEEEKGTVAFAFISEHWQLQGHHGAARIKVTVSTQSKSVLLQKPFT